MSFNQGNTISAEYFMTNLVELYDDYWRGPKDTNGNLIVYAFDADHNDPASLRRKGWGQSQLETKGSPLEHLVSTGMLVEREHLNTVIAQINAGLYHIDNTNTLMDPRPLSANTSNRITAQEFETVRQQVTGTIDTNKFTCEDDADLVLVEDSSHNNGVPWFDDLYIEQKFVFNDYSHARHYFNAGGLLTVQLSDDGSGTIGSQVWGDIFDDMGWIGIGAINTINYGTLQGISLNKGFYSIPYENVYEQLFSYVPRSGTSSYLSLYSERRINIKAKAYETASTFEIVMRVELIEDPDDTYPIDTQITLDSGYKQPTDSPAPTDLNIDRTKVTGIPGATQYNFAEVNAPTTANVTPWTPDNL